MVKQSLRATFARAAFNICRSACIVHCISEYLCRLFVCKGPSMEPTLHSTDVIFTETVSSRLHRYNYGDIIVFKSAQNHEELVCKRIVGLPGDKINFRDKHRIPAGHVWLEGDNPDHSWDSRDYGPVPQGLIVGRVVCKIFPFKEMTMLTVKSE